VAGAAGAAVAGAAGAEVAGAAGAEVAGAAGAWVVAAGLQAANKKASMNTTDITRETFLNIQSSLKFFQTGWWKFRKTGSLCELKTCY
jgi:hypothetical protein